MRTRARLALALGCLLGFGSGCRTEPAIPSVELRLAAGAALEPLFVEKWSTALASHRQAVAVEKAVQIQVWQDQLDGTPVLFLGVAWPQGWLKEPRHVPLSSPVKLGVALDDPTPEASQVPKALDRLMELFWVQIELAQSAWPISERYLDAPYPIAVRSMTADWLGRHGQPDKALAKGCLNLLAHALKRPRDPELERLESSVACLAKVGQQADVPEILDLMPNGHLRVEMARVELMGALGGSLAVDQLRWVKEQAQDAALVRAAELALQASVTSTR